VRGLASCGVRRPECYRHGQSENETMTANRA
jgi:hypothetical protein